MYVTHFTVEGVGQFPYDMLRYDGCFPTTEQDTAMMVNDAYRLRSDEPRPNRRRVGLTTYHSEKKYSRLTDARWQSFGWQIVWMGAVE